MGKLFQERRFEIVELFGDKLRTLRKNAGLTQPQLAEKLGVTKSVVSYYEKNDRTPSPDILVKISNTFHVTTDYLLGIERKKTLDITGLSEEDEHVLELMVDRLKSKK